MNRFSLNSSMSKVSLVLLLCAFLWTCQDSGGPGEDMETPPDITPDSGAVTITHMGNQGVMITDGTDKIIVDGLHRGANSNTWTSLSGSDRSNAESANAPFDQVNLILVTHNHTDHYSVSSIGSHLSSSSTTRFYGITGVRNAMQLYSGYSSIRSQIISDVDPGAGQRVSANMGGIEVDILNMHHFVPVCGECGRNYAYIFTIGGIKMLHLGDIDMLDQDNIAEFPLADEGIDILFLATPFPSFVNEDQAATVASWINPKKIIALHLNTSSQSQIVSNINREYPDASILITPMQILSFDLEDFE